MNKTAVLNPIINIRHCFANDKNQAFFAYNHLAAIKEISAHGMSQNNE
jgi:hypothetical protein